MAIIKGTFGQRQADILTGTTGTDEFWVDNTGDRIIGGAVQDRIVSAIDWQLAEGGPSTLSLYGAAQTATGNSSGNLLVGTAGANTINGGGGMDELWGGAGADRFVIDRLGQQHADRIQDFSKAESDRIALSGAVFGLAPGSAVSFSVGAAVGTGPQVVLQGVGLWFDADGAGKGAARLFAAINGGAVSALDASCFEVI